jgi:phenylalanyl-tRNA synthetase alpha chain
VNQELEQQLARARERAGASPDLESLRQVEREFLDKSGVVGSYLAAIPRLPKEERAAAGAAANELKRGIEQVIAARQSELEQALLRAERSDAGFDPTLPGAPARRGSLHPITTVRREVEAIFGSMGYLVVDGPEVELDYYNFQALNVPPDHPSRELQDTFWCDREQTLVLRTQTSPVQIRVLERMPPPVRVIAPGRVFRHEQPDATHEHTFHQVEGLVVDEGVAVGHLIGTLRGFLRELLSVEPVVRLRPGYFPFVEPGFEFDVGCIFCKSGCRVCKYTGWIEFCGCGMVHRNVLLAGRVDPDRYSGFAFGFGLDRLAMMRYQIDDIRHFMGGDLRFLEQF